MFVSCDIFRNSSSTSPVRRILGKLRRTGGVRARLPCVLSYLLSGSAQARGLYQRVSSHFTLLSTPPARIGSAYPAPNPGRDKDKALYCRPIACGRRSSVYVCPPCNRSPATGRCVAGNLVTITRRTPPSLSVAGKRRVEGWPWGLGFSGRPASLAWVLLY